MAVHFKRNARFDVIFILTERELPVPGDCRLIPERHLAFHHLSIICQDTMRDGILLLVGYKISELCVCCYGFVARTARWWFSTGTRSNIPNVSWQSRCFQTCFYGTVILICLHCPRIKTITIFLMFTLQFIPQMWANRAIEVMQALSFPCCCVLQQLSSSLSVLLSYTFITHPSLRNVKFAWKISRLLWMLISAAADYWHWAVFCSAATRRWGHRRDSEDSLTPSLDCITDKQSVKLFLWRCSTERCSFSSC